MSWWGSHPSITREAARALLPPGACKTCVYAVRCGAFSVEDRLRWCDRCQNTEENRKELRERLRSWCRVIEKLNFLNHRGDPMVDLRSPDNDMLYMSARPSDEDVWIGIVSSRGQDVLFKVSRRLLRGYIENVQKHLLDEKVVSGLVKVSTGR